MTVRATSCARRASSLRPRRRGQRDDDGAVLVIVLAFVLIVGVMLTALLTEARANFASISVTKASSSRVYAANGGVEWGIQALRRGMVNNGSPVCATPSTVQDLGTMSINGRNVSITCHVDSGQAPGAGGWAVFITDVNGSIRTQPGGSSAVKTISGPVYNGGGSDGWSFLSGTSLKVSDGDVVQKQATGCTAPGAALTIAPAPPYSFACRGNALPTPPPPIPISALPDLTNAPPRPTAGTTTGSCRVFTPGRYTARPQFLTTPGTSNYFRSGVYFLDDIYDLDMFGSIVGGIPAPGDDTLGSAQPCVTESAADTGGHYGVLFLLGGHSTIEVEHQAKVELHGYLDPNQPNQPSVSVMQLQSTDGPHWAGHACMGVGPTMWSLETALSSQAELIVHGHIYSPTSRVSAYGATGATVSLLGGVVAAGLDLQANPLSGAANVSVKTNAGKRTVTLVATTDRIGSEKEISTTATVDIVNDAARTATVQSWTVRN